MSGSPKSIYRVRQLIGTDGAIVTDVAEEAESVNGYAHPKEIRNGKVRLGGVDSFWLATGVKTERKFSSPSKSAPALLPSTSATSSLIGRVKSRNGLNFSPFSDLTKTAKMENISFATASRLPIAIGPGIRTHDELVRDLRKGKLSVEIQNSVDAIEVKPDVYMISGFARNSSGHYGLSPETRLRAVPTVSVVAKVDITRLPSGIVVFGVQPKWTAETMTDLRSEDEIVAAAEGWLSRLKAAASLAGDARPHNPAELLKTYAAASVAAEEREDLASALRVLAERSELVDLLPELLMQNENLKSRLQEFELAEQDRVRAEIRARLAEEAEQEASRLAEVRELILDAEGRLATVSHREVLLRSETEKVDAQLKERITEAARAVGGASLEATEKLREEVAQVRIELENIGRASTAEVVAEIKAHDSPLAGQAPQVMTLVAASGGDRMHVLRELASSTGLALADLVAVVLHSTEGVPVLVGDGSAGIAVDIATAIGGDSAAIVFCDPTHVSLADLQRNDAAGLGEAIEAAKDNPGLLVPVALCGLTNGPCEYWLPQLVEMRRAGRLPANLAFFASAGTDGLRVSVPKSVLRYFFPLAVSRTELAARVPYVGSWKPFAPHNALVQNAIRILRGKSVDPSLMGRLASLLSRVPMATGEEQAEIASALIDEQKWVAAWRDGADHELMQHFQNLGN
ncbi:hypothetical protein [Rhizobium mongolense]|uniref:Uncharacterized protein n=1 Tax=Rhizobium mongolense TaxID=57676 RepID=A0A7W6RKT4_9HYPH|nr:hypothetical protein [Rhizobium mongolense]MBB4274127.1 hypothetical protein [Rhizobium mongolense]